MIVVAIIGILAAVAIPGFMQYIKNSKTSEAKTNLNAIGKGALSYFEAEHLDADGMSGFSKQYPASSNVVTVGKKADANTVGMKSAPNAAETVPNGGTAQGSPAAVWAALNFNITGAIYYYYSYKGTGKTVTPGANGGSTTTFAKSYFQANATASLSSETDSIFCINGYSTGKISPIVDGSDGAGANLTPTCTANTATPPTAD